MYRQKKQSPCDLIFQTCLYSFVYLFQHGYDSGSESGRGSSPSCYSSGAMISPDSSASLLSSDQNNIAYVLKTLTTIVVGWNYPIGIDWGCKQ